jgi:hypothetical protein
LSTITWTSRCGIENSAKVVAAPNGEAVFDVLGSGRAYTNITPEAAAEIIAAFREVFPGVDDDNYYVTVHWTDNPKIGVHAGRQEDMSVGPEHASHEEAALARARELLSFRDGHFTHFDVRHRGVVKKFKNTSHLPPVEFVYSFEEVSA